MAFIASSCFPYMIFFIRFLYAAKMSSKNIQSNLHCLSSGRRNLPISTLLPSINICKMDTAFPFRMLVSWYFICFLPLHILCTVLKQFICKYPVVLIPYYIYYEINSPLSMPSLIILTCIPNVFFTLPCLNSNPFLSK